MINAASITARSEAGRFAHAQWPLGETPKTRHIMAMG